MAMAAEQNMNNGTVLAVPDALQPSSDQTLPELTDETLQELQSIGWYTVGIVVAFIDPQGEMMLLEHRGRAKNEPGAWGPLSETSQRQVKPTKVDPIIEQPRATLFRGITEELGVQDPKSLELQMHARGGWVVNQWPLGRYSGREHIAAGISFPVFINNAIKKRLESFSHGTEEISNMCFRPPDVIDDLMQRLGVEGWLAQLMDTDLLTPDSQNDLQPVDFSNVDTASLEDIRL